MKNSEYYGIGISENDVWKTLDNGKTWENITRGSEAGICKSNGRIIFSSSENKGLSYSDDGGKTKNSSNILDGNWNNIVYSNGKVYSSSMDGKGIVSSSDDGENWTLIAEGGKYTDMNIINGKAVFKGNPNLVIDNDKIKFVANKVDFSSMSLDEILLYILNKIIAPKIYYESTGKIFDEDSKDISTLFKEEANSYYVNNNNYIKSKTLINFEEDVGMTPFFNDSNNYYKYGNIIINDSQKEDNQIMKSTMIKVRKYLNSKKSEATKNIINVIENIEPDKNNLLDVDREDINDVIEAERLYERVSKSSVEFVMISIYNKIFNLPDYMIRRLIFLGVYEELNFISGTVRSNLLDIFNNGYNIEESIKNMNIKYSYSDGLKIAIEKYLNNINSTIKKMTESEDEDMKEMAISTYKKFRSNYIEQADEYAKNIYVDSDSFVFNGFDEINKEIKETDENGYVEKIVALLKKDTNFSNDDVKRLIEFSYLEMLKQTGEIKIDFNPIVMSKDEAKNISPEKSSMSKKYLDDIHNEFKLRCYDLLRYVKSKKDFEEIEKNIEININSYIKNYKSNYIETIKDMSNADAKKYCEKNLLNINDKISDNVEFIVLELYKDWHEYKEKI